MKNIAHTLNALIIIYTFLLLQGGANAAFWEDHFEQEAVDDWQHVGNDSVWTVEDGFLRAEIQAQNQWSVIFERYQFIAYPSPYNDFTITLETVGATRARFGIALAKHFRNPVTEIEEFGYYLFFTKRYASLKRRWCVCRTRTTLEHRRTPTDGTPLQGRQISIECRWRITPRFHGRKLRSH